jgi:diadenosine tetraphosphatase ApaH/serine/threonine PP2A family protein phosphatase
MAYGFHAEMEAKYAQTARGMYTSCLALFAVLPLAAQVDSVLVMHGGLFRRPAPRTRSGGAVTAEALCVGSLEDLRTASSGAHTRVCSHCVSPPSSPSLCLLLCLPHCVSLPLSPSPAGGPDPDGLGASVLASDVLWSDPMMQPGMRCVQPGVLPAGVWGQWACSTAATQLHSLSHRRAGRQCRENEARGVGVLFGPDVTQQFLVHAQPRPWC